MSKKVGVLLLISVLTSTLGVIFAKLSQSPSSIMSMYRMFIAAILIAPFAYKYKDELKRLTKNEWFSLTLSGLFLALHFTLWFEGIKLSTVTTSTIIMALQPIIALFFGLLFYKERIGIKTFIAILISFSGIVIVSSGDFDMSNLEVMFGNGLILLSVTSIVIYLMLGKKAVIKLTHWIYSATVFLISGIFLLIYNIIQQENMINYASNEWLIFLLLGIFPTIAHIIYNYLLNHISPTTISMSILLEPIGASLIAFIFLNENITQNQIIGGIIVLLGVYAFLRIKE